MQYSGEDEKVNVATNNKATRICTYIYIYIHTHTDVYTSIYLYICICIYVHICKYTVYNYVAMGCICIYTIIIITTNNNDDNNSINDIYI